MHILYHTLRHATLQTLIKSGAFEYTSVGCRIQVNRDVSALHEGGTFRRGDLVLPVKETEHGQMLEIWRASERGSA